MIIKYEFYEKTKLFVDKNTITLHTNYFTEIGIKFQSPEKMNVLRIKFNSLEDY